MTDLSASAGTRPGAHELQSRAGYDPAFLGVGVPTPTPTTPAPTVALRYLHYSLLFRPDRRFAAVTALAMDGARLVQVDRTDDWDLDPRLAAELQAGPPVYAHDDLDRGHLVMRASSAWGTPRRRGGWPRPTRSTSPTPYRRTGCSTRAGSRGWGWRTT
jgi:endonuclease G